MLPLTKVMLMCGYSNSNNTSRHVINNKSIITLGVMLSQQSIKSKQLQQHFIVPYVAGLISYILRS